MAPTTQLDSCSASSINPFKWTPEKMKRVAITTFVVTTLALIVAVLMAKYPLASGAFITIFSITSGISAIALAALLIKNCTRKKGEEISTPAAIYDFAQEDRETTTTISNPTFPISTPTFVPTENRPHADLPVVS